MAFKCPLIAFNILARFYMPYPVKIDLKGILAAQKQNKIFSLCVRKHFIVFIDFI